jgi:2-(1,2-epoxy-1,2-dihydrophenyl)acetyl-CoA isomerase
VTEGGAGAGAAPGAEPPRVLLEVDGPIAIVRLNRPERLNAITEECREALLATLARVKDDAAVRAVIVTGAGRAFSAGGDLGRLVALREAEDAAGFARILDGQLAVTRALTSLPQIAIAAVNGPCAGAGLDIALACDVRVASETATFGAPFLGLGILPDVTALELLPRVVGQGRAFEMFVTADFVKADEALRARLVARVVPPGDLLGVARVIGRAAAARPPALVARLKRALGSGPGGADWSTDYARDAQIAAFLAPESLASLRAARDRISK